MRALAGVRALPGRGRALIGRTFRSLHIRNYRLWFFGQIVSTSGTWMQSVAQGWLVLRVTGSAIDLGVTVALQFLPFLLFGPWGGVVADRFDKRQVLVATQSLFAVQALVLGLLTLTGVVQIWMVWVLAFLMGVVNVVDNPTRQSFAVEMVGPEDLANAVGLNSVIINSSRIIGPAIAGLLIATVSLSAAFLVNAVSFVAVIASLATMDVQALQRARPVPRAKGQVRAGLRYAWSLPDLRIPLLLLAVIGALGYNFSVLLPLMAKVAFHKGGGTYGALLSAMGVGALAGALIAASRRRPSRRLLTGSALAFGAFSLLVAWAPTLHLGMIALVPMGAAGIIYVATTNSLLQLGAKASMRGRVMALWAMVFLGSTPIGGPLAGFVAGRLGPRAALALGGVATIVAAGWGTLAFRASSKRRRAAAGEPAGGVALVTAQGEAFVAARARDAGRPAAAAGARHRERSGEPL
jgi:MFS family permease